MNFTREKSGTGEWETQPIETATILRPFYLATTMTLLAGAIYIVVWGILLFPGGSLAGKAMWTLTCGVAMGAVIGGLTIVVASKPRNAIHAAVSAAAIMALAGIYCGFLCSRIDARFNYFGSPENTNLFIAAAIIPAMLGGITFGWLLYTTAGNRSAIRLRLWRARPSLSAGTNNGKGA